MILIILRIDRADEACLVLVPFSALSCVVIALGRRVVLATGCYLDKEFESVSVYKYRVTSQREDIEEEGTVIAKDESDAKTKLELLKYKHIHVKQLKGVKGLIGQFSADIK